MKLHPRLLLLSLLLAILVALPSQAQTTPNGANSLTETLATLPESQAVVYVNTSRILKDAMPRLLPEKEMRQLREGMDQIKAMTNVDPRNIEFFIITMRFNKPTGDMKFPIPEAMFVMRGDFDAKSLINMATAMSGGMLHEDKFGDHVLYLLKLSDVTKSVANNPFGAAFSEIAVTTLDASTIAVGNTTYIKSALDAADGRGRIKPETLASFVRDPGALISTSGFPLMAFARSFGLRMAESNDPNCITKFGEYYLSLTMSETAFNINGAINADNPDTARMIKNMLSGLLQEGKDLVPDKDAQTVFNQLKLFTEGDEVRIEASISQEMAAKFVRDLLAPKPPPAKVTATDTSVTKPVEPKTTVKPNPKTTKSQRKG